MVAFGSSCNIHCEYEVCELLGKCYTVQPSTSEW